MALDEKQKAFIELRALTAKPMDAIADEMGVSQETLWEWNDVLSEYILERKAKEFDMLVEKHGLSTMARFKYQTALYERLRNELDKRDFSGLPTDKLYYIMKDVETNIEHQYEDLEFEGDFDDDDLLYDIDEEDH